MKVGDIVVTEKFGVGILEAIHNSYFFVKTGSGIIRVFTFKSVRLADKLEEHEYRLSLSGNQT